MRFQDRQTRSAFASALRTGMVAAVLACGMPLPAGAAMELPEAVRSAAQDYVESCQATGGSASPIEDFVTTTSFAGRAAYLVDTGASGCMHFCGSAGCMVELWIEQPGGAERLFYSNVHGLELTELNGRPAIDLILHGSACGRIGAEGCFKTLVYSDGGLEETYSGRAPRGARADAPETAPATFSRLEISDIQRGLARAGYDPGPADGLMGRRTAAAIRAFQADNGLAVSGVPSRALYELLAADGGGRPPAGQAQGRDDTVALTILGKRFDLALSYPVDEPRARRPAEAIAHFPSDLRSGGGEALSDRQILEILEERTWAAQFQYEQAFEALLEREAATQAPGRVNEVEERLFVAFDRGEGDAVAPRIQALHDQHLALSLAARGLRQRLGLGERPSGLGHFTVPEMPAAVRDAFTRQGFDPEAAYLSYRLVRAVYRAGDPSLLHRAAAFPVRVYEKQGSRTISGRAELEAAGPLVMNRVLQQIVLGQDFEELFVRNQGAMFGNGELWMTPVCGQGRCSDRLALGTINAIDLPSLEPVVPPGSAP